jgi:hypothetical protein
MLRFQSKGGGQKRLAFPQFEAVESGFMEYGDLFRWRRKALDHTAFRPSRKQIPIIQASEGIDGNIFGSRQKSLGLQYRVVHMRRVFFSPGYPAVGSERRHRPVSFASRI